MASLDNCKILDVDFITNKHRIYLGCSLLDDSSLLKEQLFSRKVCIITNNVVGNYYLSKIKQSLHGIQYDVLLLPDGEKYKNSSSLNNIYDFLITNNHHRDTTIIGLGGGVIGDIAAFAASTYQRGVRLIHIPTTLLAQVDSCIGGKTAINHKFGKNLIGSFYYPHSILIDVSTLRTLPKRELCSGFAEVIKYGLLVGEEFLGNLSEVFSLDIENDNLDKFIETIMQSVAIKINIVKQDEQELKGVRQLLNLGHTFAHGIEAVTNYQRYLHGEAVAIGLHLAAKLSYYLRYLSAKDVERVDNLLAKAGLPNKLPNDINIDKLKSAMLLDKKIRNNVLPFVVIKRFGDCVVDYSVTESLLTECLLEG